MLLCIILYRYHQELQQPWLSYLFAMSTDVNLELRAGNPILRPSQCWMMLDVPTPRPSKIEHEGCSAVWSLWRGPLWPWGADDELNELNCMKWSWKHLFMNSKANRLSAQSRMKSQHMSRMKSQHMYIYIYGPGLRAGTPPPMVWSPGRLHPGYPLRWWSPLPSTSAPYNVASSVCASTREDLLT